MSSFGELLWRPKRITKRIIRGLGYEVCRLDQAEELRGFSYKEAQCYRAMSSLGELSIEEIRLLGELVQKSDPERPIIEIGTLFGLSTMVMTMFKNHEQSLITVDNYSWNPLGLSSESHYRITRRRLSEAIERHRVSVVRMAKDAFYASYGGPPPALFFCDADHSYEATKADLMWAQSVGADIICGDDYNLPSEDGVRRAVADMGGPSQLVDGLFVL